MSIQRLHHVQVTIPRDAEAEARRFYCDVLGLVEIPKPASLLTRGGFWVKLGEQQLHVGVEDGVDRWTSKAHLAYQVEDVETWRHKLTATGCELLDSIPIEGFHRFETRDPFGNRIEFIQPIITAD
jgi:catechol 2,3-dioxygenase-like lactoylglutathione lyase family enzyme